MFLRGPPRGLLGMVPIRRRAGAALRRSRDFLVTGRPPSAWSRTTDARAAARNGAAVIRSTSRLVGLDDDTQDIA